MRNGRMGIVAAMEEEQSIAALQDIGLGNNACGVEVDLISITELNAEFTSAEADTSNAVEVAEALESIAIALEASGQTLNKSGAQILNITLNSLYKSVGVVNKQSGIATESLDNKDCVSFSKVALENIGDSVKKIWEAIMNAIKKSIEWVKEFFKRIFGANKKMEEKVAKTEEDIRNKENNKSSASPKQGKENTFTNDHIYKILEIGGKFPTNISNEIINYEKLSQSILITIEDVLFNAFSDVMGKLEFDRKDLNKTLVIPKINFGSVFKGEKHSRITPIGLIFMHSNKSFGNIKINISVPEREDKGISALKNISQMIIIEGDMEGDGYTAEPIPYLTIDECKAVIKEIKKIIDLINDKSEDVKKIIDFKEKTIKLGKEIFFSSSNDRDTNLDHYTHSDIAIIQNALSRMASNVNGISKKYLSKAININSALIQYVELSIDNQ